MPLSSLCGVYLIVSPSGGRYVGSSKSLKKRVNRYKNHSCSRQSAIKASLDKYGFDKHKFRVLYYCEENELLFWERVFGDIYLASANFPNGLNISLPGYDDIPAIRTEQWKNRVSEVQKKRFKDPLQRLKTSIATKAGFTAEVKQKMSAYWKERCSTDDFRKERSERQKKYFSSEEARDKVRVKVVAYYKNNPSAKETQRIGLKKYYDENPFVRQERMLKIHKANPNMAKEHSKKMKLFYQNNPDAKKAISERTINWLANNHPTARKIIDTSTGEVFKSVIQVCEKINKPIQTVRNWLNGVVKNKSTFKYAENS